MKKMSSNKQYYGKLSEMLEDVIQQRKIEAMSYEEYLRQVVELAESILHPERKNKYPEKIRTSVARMALFEYFHKDEDLTLIIDETIRNALQPGWKGNFQKQRRIQKNICKKLLDHGYTSEVAQAKALEIFDLANRQEEYDV